MILTLVHVALGLLGIGLGAVVVVGMGTGKQLDVCTPLFLLSSVWTIATGFLFYPAFYSAAHVVGIIAMLALSAAIPALYIYRLEGAWRWTYVAGVVLVLYLDILVGAVHVSQKASSLRRLSPIQPDPQVLVAHLAVMTLFLVVGVVVAARFRPTIAPRLRRRT